MTVDMAWILADQDLPEVADDGGQSGREEALSQPRQAVIRLDADEGPIIICLDDGGADAGDLHGRDPERAVNESDLDAAAATPARIERRARSRAGEEHRAGRHKVAEMLPASINIR